MWLRNVLGSFIDFQKRRNDVGLSPDGRQQTTDRIHLSISVKVLMTRRFSTKSVLIRSIDWFINMWMNNKWVVMKCDAFDGPWMKHCKTTLIFNQWNDKKWKEFLFVLKFVIISGMSPLGWCGRMHSTRHRMCIMLHIQKFDKNFSNAIQWIQSPRIYYKVYRCDVEVESKVPLQSLLRFFPFFCCFWIFPLALCLCLTFWTQ